MELQGQPGHREYKVQRECKELLAKPGIQEHRAYRVRLGHREYLEQQAERDPSAQQVQQDHLLREQ